MTFFSHRPGFSDFLFLFPDFPYLLLHVHVCSMYDPFLTRTITISEKNSFMTPFLLCSYFRAHPTTLLLKILGHGPSPPQIFFGDRPPRYALGLRPWSSMSQ